MYDHARIEALRGHRNTTFWALWTRLRSFLVEPEAMSRVVALHHHRVLVVTALSDRLDHIVAVTDPSNTSTGWRG
jgi:hypothetical protein